MKLEIRRKRILYWLNCKFKGFVKLLLYKLTIKKPYKNKKNILLLCILLILFQEYLVKTCVLAPFYKYVKNIFVNFL